MSFFRYYFHYELKDIASLILQISYASCILADYLNIRHKDPYKENVIVKPVPSLGLYHLTYTFHFEGLYLRPFISSLITFCTIGEKVFSFVLYTKYIFSIIDFVSIEVFNVYGKTPNELIDIFNGMKRSRSISSNRDMSCFYSIYTFIRNLWESLESYFSLAHLAKNGFDIRQLDMLSKGFNEFILIIEKLEEIFGGSLVKITDCEKLKKVTKIKDPSFSAFDCRMSIQFVPDSNSIGQVEPNDTSKSNSTIDDESGDNTSIFESKGTESTKPVVKKKRGRPKIYNSKNERQRHHRIKKKRIKYENSYQHLIQDEDMLKKIKSYNNYYFNIPETFVNQLLIDTDLVEYVFRDGRFCVLAQDDIRKSKKITQFTGWIEKKIKDPAIPHVNIKNKIYCGISYPRFLKGVGSLIREANKNEVPNVKIESYKSEVWVIASINISKGDELIRRALNE